MIDSLQIDDKCQVRWQRGDVQNLTAIVVDRRRSDRKRKADPSDPDLSSLKADQMEYYVHYVGHDRRLDEWIALDKFLLNTLQRHSETDAAAVEADTGVSNSNVAEPRAFRRRSTSSFDLSIPSGVGSSAVPSLATSSATAASNLLTGGNWHGASGDPSLAAFEKEHEERTKVKNIEKIVVGGWEVEAWYYSPFPDAYCNLKTLYVCEFCLSYMKKKRTYRKHNMECSCKRPPGKEIYRNEDLAVYELDGKDHRAYCQKLCLLAKLFLDHKTLYYDVNPFFFYIVCRVSEEGSHVVGYFSKEKVSNEGYNLACILTFPQYQKSGYGKFIISLSYELTKREGKTGSPEKPLSDLGKVSYRSYWTHTLMNLLDKHDPSTNISINDICQRTGIKQEDIISTLQSLDMIKVWKGQHVVYVRQDIIRNYMKQGKNPRLCKQEFLDWTPPDGAKEN